MSSSSAELVVRPPLAGRALQPDTIRQALTDAGRTHPMDLCEWCGTPDPCPDPDCQAAFEDLYAPFSRQIAYCPWCGDPVAGLLTDCDKPDCARRALDVEMTHVRREDR